MSAIEELLKEYLGEVNVAASSFYAWKNINNLATDDPALFQALQRNALSWNLIAHALQITFFSALGRLFDRDKRSLTVRTFISNCEAAIGQFSKPAFEARRLASNHCGFNRSIHRLSDFINPLHRPVESATYSGRSTRCELIGSF